MGKYCKAETSKRALESLEKAILSHAKVPVTLASAVSVSIVDEEGKTLNIEDMPSAYLALIFIGRLDKVREVESASLIKADVKGHELAAIAAQSGYQIAARAHVANVEISNFIQMDSLLGDFSTIERVTGKKPEERINDLVYSNIVKLTATSDKMSALRKYSSRVGLPSEECAQVVYASLVSLNHADSLARVRWFYKHTGIAPKIGSREMGIEDYVYQMNLQIRMSGQSLEKANFPHYLLIISQANQHEFLTLFEGYAEKFVKADYAEKNSIQKAHKVLSLFYVAAENKVTLNDNLLKILPGCIMMSAALPGYHDGRQSDRICGTIDALAESAQFDANDILWGIQRGFGVLSDVYLPFLMQSDPVNIWHRNTAKKYINDRLGGRIDIIHRFASHLGDLNSKTEAAPYLARLEEKVAEAVAHLA